MPAAVRRAASTGTRSTSVLCVGLYDGFLGVYDVRSKTQAPIYQSTVKTGKHTDPVWEVCWQEEDLSKNLNFFSISSDGRVTLWTLAKSELEFSDLMQLKLVQKTSTKGGEDEEDSALMGLAGGCCFDFSRMQEHLFLVGTEEGWIHKCSKAYNSEYLQTYSGHYMAVYTVRWNPFHQSIFACIPTGRPSWGPREEHAADVVRPERAGRRPRLVAWSSTTLPRATPTARCMFDLNENKNEPYCERSGARWLTKVAFNSKADTPIIRATITAASPP